MIAYQRTVDLSLSAEITYNNMRKYYAHYQVDWLPEKIEEQILELDNWDILLNHEVVGAIRLSIDGNECWVRDLQVDETHQNKGIGANALAEAERLAKIGGASLLKLRVFKISPAINLYKRSGYKVCDEEERFYYLKKHVN